MAADLKTTGALPALPTGISMADPDVKQQYNESIQKVLESLENRSQIPWFKIAAALGDPGRTGSAGEAYGKAFGVLGQQQEEERARALPIAQMRAQLAGQQYEMSKEEKALNAFANALGTTPNNLQAGMQSALYNPAMMQRLNAAMPMFYGSPKIMEMAKTMFGQFNDISKMIMEERKLGLSEVELVEKYGPQVRALIAGSIPNIQTPPAGTRSPMMGQPAPTAGAPTGSEPAGRDPNLIYDDKGNVIDVRAVEAPEDQIFIQGQPVSRPSQQGERPTTQPTIRTATEATDSLLVFPDKIVFPDGRILQRGSTPTESWNKTVQDERQAFNRQREADIKFEREQISKAGEQRDATVESRVKEVGAINPDEISRTQGLLQSLGEIIKDPEMAGAFGLMIKQGIAPALYELAKDSVRVGNTTISVDAYNALIKQLPAKVQEKLRGSQMLLSELFIQKAREAKSAFGPAISNFDILMQKERMASIRDTPKLINNWIAQELTMTEQKKEIAREYAKFLRQAAGTKTKPSDFFNSEAYENLSDKYSQIYKDLAIISYGAPR